MSTAVWIMIGLFGAALCVVVAYLFVWPKLGRERAASLWIEEERPSIAEKRGEASTVWLGGLTLTQLVPYVALILTIAMMGLGIYVIVAPRFSADDKKAAWGIFGTVLGFWFGVGAKSASE